MKKILIFLLLLTFVGFAFKGELNIQAVSKEDPITIAATDDFTTIPGIILYLEQNIPSQTTTNLTLPTTLGRARLTWSSSDPYTISTTGVVSRNSFDATVQLSCSISLKGKTGSFVRDVLVLKYELKSLVGKKVTFTYLYDYGTSFKGFRTGDLDKIDVINYSFGGISTSNTVTFPFPNYQTIIPQAHDKGVRVVLAIGGWGVDGFSDACLTSATRQTFINSIISTIQKYKLDGIDFDWEYPTLTAGGLITGRPEDKVNFTSLVRETRQAMDALNPDLILSIAVPAGAWAVNLCYEPALLNPYIDYLHVMSYDLIDYSTLITMHHTNLYSSQYNQVSGDVGVRAYDNAGFDLNKIVLGIAFFGHSYVTTQPGTNGIGATSSSHSTITYNNIAINYLNNPAYTVYWDDDAKASWIYGNNTFITYDDPRSIAEKCIYVNTNGMAGVMVWQYSQDDANSTLLNAIYSNIN